MTAILWFIQCAFFVYKANAFAEWMTTDYCSRSLQVGSVIMNADVLESNQRSLTVFRNDEQLFDNSIYYPGDLLQVKISDSNNEYVYEVENAEFEGGGCDGTRIANKAVVTVELPIGAAASVPVKLRVGWAEGHSTVRVSKDFVLLPSNPMKSQRQSLAPQLVDGQNVTTPKELKHHNVTSAMEAVAKVFVSKEANYLRKRRQEEDSNYVASTDKHENSLISQREDHKKSVPSLATVQRPSLDAAQSVPASRPNLATQKDRPSVSGDEASAEEGGEEENIAQEYPETKDQPTDLEYPEERIGDSAMSGGDNEEGGEGESTTSSEGKESEEGEEEENEVPELTRKPRSLGMKAIDFEQLRSRVWRYLFFTVAAVLAICYFIFLYRISVVRLIRKLFNRPRFEE